MDQPTFEQLPEMVSRILKKMEHLEKLIQEKTLNNDQEKMLNIKEAALFLDLSIPTLYSKVCRNEIPVHKPGKRLYFQKSALLDWIKGGQPRILNIINIESETPILFRKMRSARRLK